MPTISQVVEAFKKDEIDKIISTFYDNIIESKKPGRPNHNGTISFCQFVKNAKIKKINIKRERFQTDLVETTISGVFDDQRLEIMRITDVSGWILSPTEGYRIHLIIDNEMLVDYEVNRFQTLIGLYTYIKGGWIDMIINENKIYKKDIDKAFMKNSTIDDSADPDRYKI